MWGIDPYKWSSNDDEPMHLAPLDLFILGSPQMGLKGLTGSRNQISMGLQHEEGVGGEELIGQDHQLPALVTSLGRYSLNHDRMSSWDCTSNILDSESNQRKVRFCFGGPKWTKGPTYPHMAVYFRRTRTCSC